MLFAEGLLSSAQASFRLLAERLDTFTDKAFSRSLRISSTLSFVSLQTQEHIVSISVVDSGSSEVVDGTVIFYRRRQKHLKNRYIVNEDFSSQLHTIELR